ncbi:hypothetical protein ACFL6D_04590, partial [Spirochaetota bacterium]
MSKQRLSNFQKWILERCYKNISIHRNEAREYYNKKYSPSYKGKIISSHIYKNHMQDHTPYIRKYGKNNNEWYEYKEEFISTKAIESAITRSFKLLINNGYLAKFEKYGDHYLTEKGFLKVNNYNP